MENIKQEYINQWELPSNVDDTMRNTSDVGDTQNRRRVMGVITNIDNTAREVTLSRLPIQPDKPNVLTMNVSDIGNGPDQFKFGLLEPITSNEITKYNNWLNSKKFQVLFGKGKRNKSKKPKRRKSRSKRRKTLNKSRR